MTHTDMCTVTACRASNSTKTEATFFDGKSSNENHT